MYVSCKELFVNLLFHNKNIKLLSDMISDMHKHKNDIQTRVNNETTILLLRYHNTQDASIYGWVKGVHILCKVGELVST